MPTRYFVRFSSVDDFGECGVYDFINWEQEGGFTSPSQEYGVPATGGFRSYTKHNYIEGKVEND